MATASVHALSTGSLTLSEKFFITPADPNAKKTVPSMSFLVQHNPAGNIGRTTRLVFDLGLRRDVTLYPKVLETHIRSREPWTTQPDAIASLTKGGLTPSDIDFVMFSHVHYDHVGCPKDFADANPNTKFIVGPGATDLLSGKVVLDLGTHCVFEPDLLPLDRTIELPPVPETKLAAPKPLPVQSELSTSTPLMLSWSSRPIAPFEHTIDLFDDGTIYIVNAPGHLPGHINLMIRTSTSPLKYIILAGDACHDMRLFTGECDIATWTDDRGKYCCIHYDIPRAKETIARLAQVQKHGIDVEIDGKLQHGDVEVVFAHNWAWEEDAVRRNRFWPGRI